MITKCIYLIVFYLTILTVLEVFKAMQSSYIVQPAQPTYIPQYKYYYNVTPHPLIQVPPSSTMDSHEILDDDKAKIITENAHSIVYDNLNLNNQIIENRQNRYPDQNPYVLQNVKFSNTVSDAFQQLSQRHFETTPLNFIKRR